MWGLGWRSWGVVFVFVYWVTNCYSTICWKDYLYSTQFLLHVSKISLLSLCRSVSGFSVLFCWSLGQQTVKNTLYDTIMVDTTTCVSIPTEYMTPRVNPNINCELWVLMMCQFTFISCNKGTHSGGGCWWWRRWHMCGDREHIENFFLLILLWT